MPTSPSAPTPFRRLIATLKDDRKDLGILCIYTVFSGLLTLGVPLAAQAVVNTIAAGVFLQPLVVLTLLVLVGLLFAGVLRVFQFYLVEILQQRIFTRVALNLAYRLPRIQHLALLRDYPPELINRFFDVIQVQKAYSKLLLDGPSAMLQIVVSLLLMAFYSPLLLGFDMLILIFIVFLTLVLGRNGVHTSVAESSEKYRVASWLEEVGRCQVGFKVDGAAKFTFVKADERVVHYLTARRSHFRILLRQMVANSFFQAFASAGILGLGGWLVINRQLTLGQLVASELVMLILLAALDKLVVMLQDWYDLLTAITKIASITDLPLEEALDEEPLLDNTSESKMDSTYFLSPVAVSADEIREGNRGASVLCQGVYFSYEDGGPPLLSNLTFSIAPGEIVSLVGGSGVGKSTLAALICGLMAPRLGLVSVDGQDVRTAQLTHLWARVAWASDNVDIFQGTVEENLLVGRAISAKDVHWALETSCLLEDVALWPQGLQTPLVSAGRNLSRGQIQRLTIARAIADRPRLLILDEAFTGIDERTKLKMLDALLNPANGWTVIDISHDAEVVLRADRVMVLADGAIQESAPPVALLQQAASRFATLFPDLSLRVRTTNMGGGRR
ncbi:MAG: ATP-binding cassette domain-containing protein [Candidatus Melainabacteria bacterium]|nr:ATP-binding cassette domain-containing protein [Candidatus Melainabacteria bacterium]